jgi:hypothetical protein
MGAIVIYGDRSDSSFRAQVRSLDAQSDTTDGQERFRARPWINRLRGPTGGWYNRGRDCRGRPSGCPPPELRPFANLRALVITDSQT